MLNNGFLYNGTLWGFLNNNFLIKLFDKKNALLTWRFLGMALISFKEMFLSL